MDKTKFDVAVIGSGMGGLSAAALLAKSGLKVLVTERLKRIGGRCSSFEYQGFQCPTAAISPEVGATLEGIYREVGAEFNVRPLQKVSFRIGGKTVQPGGLGMRGLLTAATVDADEIDRLMTAYRRAMRWDSPSRTLTLREWLLQYTENHAVHGVFKSIIQSVLLVNLDEVSAHDYFQYMKIGGTARAGYPPSGPLGFIEPLARVVKTTGGDVWTEAPATRIIVEDGHATGIAVRKDGTEVLVEARAVISNIGPIKTVELAGERHFDRGYLIELRQKLRAVPMFWFHIQSDRPFIDDDAVMVCDSRRVVAIFNPTRLCPELAPKGKHLILAHGTLISSLPPYDLKHELELNLRDLEECLPGFDRNRNILMTGVFKGDWPGGRSWPGLDMPQKTSIEFLYTVGDGNRPPGTQGLPSCAASARIAVEDIKKRLKPG